MDYAKARAQADTEIFGVTNMLKKDVQPNQPPTKIQKQFNKYLAKAETNTIILYEMSNIKLKTPLKQNIRLLLTASISADVFISNIENSVE